MHNTYVRADGVVGVGFEIDFSQRKQHSIAWPDRIAERMLDDELKEHMIEVSKAVGDDRQCCSAETCPMEKPKNEFQLGREIPGIGRVFNVNSEGVHIDDIATDDATKETLNTIGEALVESIETASSEVTPEVSETPEVTQEPEAVEIEQPSTEPKFEFDPRATEAANITAYLTVHPVAGNKEVITALHSFGMEVSSSQVSTARKKLKESATSEESQVEAPAVEPTLEG
jgi:hypothetical protein